MTSFAVPDSLREWDELNVEADQAADEGNWAQYRILGEKIADAWESAPLRDRTRVSWELLKKVWRERHDAIQSGEFGP